MPRPSFNSMIRRRKRQGNIQPAQKAHRIHVLQVCKALRRKSQTNKPRKGE